MTKRKKFKRMVWLGYFEDGSYDVWWSKKAAVDRGCVSIYKCRLEEI